MTSSDTPTVNYTTRVSQMDHPAGLNKRKKRSKRLDGSMCLTGHKQSSHRKCRVSWEWDRCQKQADAHLFVLNSSVRCSQLAVFSPSAFSRNLNPWRSTTVLKHYCKPEGCPPWFHFANMSSLTTEKNKTNVWRSSQKNATPSHSWANVENTGQVGD